MGQPLEFGWGQGEDSQQVIGCTQCCHMHRWNQLDLAIVLLSIMGIALEEIETSAALPINPTIIRIMRVLRIARGRCPHSWVRRGEPAQPHPGPTNAQLSAAVLKLLKMATGMRALLDTVVQALPQVGGALAGRGGH